MVSPLLLGPILEFGKAVLDRVIEDPEKKREAELELVRMSISADMQTTLAQLEINAREAQSSSFWVSGWRPYFGWVGGTGFLYVCLIYPLLVWFSAIKGWPAPPDLSNENLWTVVFGILGLGGLRTIEKAKKVA